MDLFRAAQSLPFMSQRKRPKPQEGARLTHWLMGIVEEGRPPLQSAWALAEQYRQTTTYRSDRERVRALVRNEVSKSFSAGFLTGLGGSLALPVAVPAAAAAAWLLQARLVAAMAYLLGHDRHDPWVRAAVLVTLDDARQGAPMVQGSGHMGDWAARRIAAFVAPRAFKALEHQVGRRLLSGQFKRGAVRWMPVFGAVVAGSLDAREAYVVAQRAFRTFAGHGGGKVLAQDDGKADQAQG